MTKTISWLQLSDIHLRASDAYNQDVVIESLLADLHALVAKGNVAFDLIFLTGDIAFSGAPKEYAAAETFIRKLAAITEVGVDSIFCVPGNHDVERARLTRSTADLTSRDAVSRLLADKTGLQDFLKRQTNYNSFVRRTFPWAPALPGSNLGYTINKDVNGIKVSILGLNSSWGSGTDDDHGKLLVGERQVRNALGSVEDPHLLIGLMHHPLSYLKEFDASDVQGLLNSRCDFVLHGHIHDFGAVALHSPDSQVFYLAAGATYQGRSAVLSYNYTHLDLAGGQAKVFVRRYSDRGGGFWSADTLMYRAAPEGILTFALPERLSSKEHSSNLEPLRQLAETLSPSFSSDEGPVADSSPTDVPPLTSVPDPPPALVQEILAGRCVLFAGSGASVDAQLPTWPQLVHDLIDIGKANGQVNESDLVELGALVANGRYLPAAEFCREKIGGFEFAGYLHRKLSSDRRTSQTHRLLSQIPFRAAVTTNYDSFIEFARPRSQVLLPDFMERQGALALAQLLGNDRFPVIKISGSLEDVDSIVLTQADFRRLSFNKPNYIDLIRKILTDYTVFFYGSGFVDPNVNLLLQEIIARAGDKARPHYAVMAEQGPIMRAFWIKNYNVRVITYPLWRESHVVAKAFLEKLVRACR